MDRVSGALSPVPDGAAQSTHPPLRGAGTLTARDEGAQTRRPADAQRACRPPAPGRRHRPLPPLRLLRRGPALWAIMTLTAK